MARQEREIANETYGERITTIGPLPMSKALISGGLELDRAGLAVSTEVHVLAEYSMDDGKSWLLWCGFTTRGNDTGEAAQLSLAHVPPKDSVMQVKVWTSGPSVRQALRMVEVE